MNPGGRAKSQLARRALAGALGMLCIAATLTARAQPAFAASYLVEVCTRSSSLSAPRSDAEFLAEAGSANFFLENCLRSDDPIGAVLNLTAKGGPTVGGVRWQLKAPEGTLIRSVSGERLMVQGLPFVWNGGMRWAAFEGPPDEELFEIADSSSLPDDGPFLWIPPSPTPSITGRLFCPLASCDNPSSAQVFLRNVFALLDDNSPPTAKIDSSTISAGPVRGTIEVPYEAKDLGSGLAGQALFVDGVLKASASNNNGGNCEPPYKHLIPCKLEIVSSFSLDTTELTDGPHTLNVIVGDASGSQQGSERQATIVVHNAPTNTARPVLSGTAKLGGQLVTTTGIWDGAPQFAFQWLRCPAKVTSLSEVGACTPIAGATKSTYEPTSADVYQRVIAKVTATNDAGSDFAFGPPSDLIPDAQGRTAPPSTQDKTPPVLTAVSLTHRKFKVGKANTALAAAAGKGVRGTVLKFTSSEAGELSISIAPPKKQKDKKAKPILLTRKIAAGPGRVAISGRIAKKPLPPGRYQVSLTATDAAGNASKQSVGLAFTILRG
jgi:hypothetical protein